MDVLIIAATGAEIAPMLQSFPGKPVVNNYLNAYRFKDLQIDILITGVGMLATVYHLGKTLQHKKYGMVINAGIAGAFNKQIPLGSVVNIVLEQLPELGAQDGSHFLSIFSLNLLGKNEFPFNNGILENTSYRRLNTLQHIKEVSGITVNTVHGEEQSIAALQARVNADVESMEGAATAYVCIQEQQPFLQMRAISNYVEPRNRAAWQIPVAVKNLNDTLLELLSELAATQ